jgi:hypothetical protein
VTGSATVTVTVTVTVTSIGAAQTAQVPCGAGAHTGTLSEQSWDARYTNGSSPLTMSEDIGGPLSLPNSASRASIVIDSVVTQPASRPAAAPAGAAKRPAAMREIRRTTIAEWDARK